MTTDDELRDIIAKGEKARKRPWLSPIENPDTDYAVAAANLTADMAAELLAARELLTQWMEMYECDVIGPVGTGNTCCGVDEGEELGKSCMEPILQKTRGLLGKTSSVEQQEEW